VRDLPAAEWAKLQQIPMVAQGLITPDPENFRAIVAELGEGPEAQIIGCWFAFNSPHLEPVWIHPDHRKRPGMIRQLWSKTIGLLQEMGVSVAFCTVADETALSSMPMVLRLGFQRVRAEAYLLNLNNPETAARVKQITRGEG
jgi:ribosomal protein S18 acetylase RimI-like enzyme